MSIKSLFRNIWKRGLKDVTNPERIKMYLTGEKIKKEGIHLSYEEIIPYAEMLVFRTIVCGSCLKNGSCHKCGCTMPDAMLTPKFPCEEEKFEPMFTKVVTFADVNEKGEIIIVEKEEIDHERWNDYKEKSGLSYLLNYS